MGRSVKYPQINILNQKNISEPPIPPDDTITVYVTATGTSPNREVTYKIKNELGELITISSILV